LLLACYRPPFFFLTLRRRPRPTLFPHTTLFRSGGGAGGSAGAGSDAQPNTVVDAGTADRPGADTTPAASEECTYLLCESFESLRSEEHTSELQSRRDLVCRLLLEKKKQIDSTEQ